MGGEWGLKIPARDLSMCCWLESDEMMLSLFRTRALLATSSNLTAPIVDALSNLNIEKDLAAEVCVSVCVCVCVLDLGH